MDPGDELTPPVSFDFIAEAVFLLGETDFPSLSVPGSDFKSDMSDFGDCVTIELLDLLIEPLSLETGVPLLPDFDSDLEVDFTDSGERMPILELVLEAVCLETGVLDRVIDFAFCSNFGEDENFLVVGE
jgi:hypothetical protein